MVKDIKYYAGLPYTTIIEKWDDGDGPYWVARVAELPHCLIHGHNADEALREIEQVKMDWIKSNLEDGLPIPEPTEHKYSGQIRLRIPPSLHKALADRAECEGLSLNSYMTTALARSTGMQVREKKGKYRSRKQIKKT